MAGRGKDEFLKITDAIPLVRKKVNLVGVVVDRTDPRRTRGTDWICSLKVIDETYSRPGLTVNVFTCFRETLPRVASIGDIILLKNVTHVLPWEEKYMTLMDNFNKEVNAVFNKKFSSFAIYDGEDGDDFLYYQCSLNFRDEAHYKNSIMSLRQWSLKLNLKKGQSKLLFLREIEEGKQFDFLCKIIYVTEDRQRIFIWDGTDIPPLSIPTNGLVDEANSNLRIYLEPSFPSRDRLRQFPTVGTILRVIVPDVDRFSHILKPGQWVKFFGLVCKTDSGIWFGTITDKTTVEDVPGDDILVKRTESLYHKRRLSNLERMPLWSFPWPSGLTEVDYEHAPFVTLMAVLKYREVTAKYRCVVRVVDISPWRVENFRSCSNGKYRIRLILEDPTARIRVILCDKDAEHFFGGYHSIDVLREKRNKLLGVKENESDGGSKNQRGSRDPPWVQCCLISYYTVKKNPWESRSYLIFGTRFVG